jgi:hypothetical protein
VVLVVKVLLLVRLLRAAADTMNAGSLFPQWAQRKLLLLALAA